MSDTIIDISWPISAATTCYKDRNTIEIKDIKIFSVDQVRETKITLGSHVGTHIDAPAHFIADGASIDQLPLNRLIGRCVVLDLMSVDQCISKKDLQQCQIRAGDIILFKTKNSLHTPTDSFDYQFIYLDQSGAEYLVAQKIKAVGIDYLGIERNQPNHETHITLMRADITILEGLRLAHVQPGQYTLVVLPLAVIGVEAAPARAILMK